MWPGLSPTAALKHHGRGFDSPGSVLLENVALFAVFADVETGGFNLRCRSQPDNELNDKGKDRRRNYAEHDGYGDGLELLDDKRLADDVLEIRIEIRVRIGRGKDARHDGAERAAHTVDAESV